jgi:hypothetical protein
MTHWLRPAVYLSNNWISRTGVALVTIATVFLIFLLFAGGGHHTNPYLGLLTALGLPGMFFLGLILIPLGLYRQRSRERRRGMLPAEFPPLNFENAAFRRLAGFVFGMTLVNVAVAGVTTYRAVEYMDSVTFCGLTCHTVMKPEFTAYQDSPHSRVGCVACHIGPGADWFVKSKISGIRQVFAVALKTYSTPIPTPVRDLRPARETCEACHWPQKFGEDLLRVIPHFADDEQSTASKSVLMMRTGAIHRAHLRQGVAVRYLATDEKRENIPLAVFEGDGVRRVYKADGAKVDENAAELRLMDCMDCHTRPSHTFETPERAIDREIDLGLIDRALPFAKKRAVEAVSQAKDAADAERIFRSHYPPGPKLDASAKGVRAAFERNVFPEMKVTWRTYPNYIGHNDFVGCFRCHDGAHTANGDVTISQDCSLCHSILATEEADPKILKDLDYRPLARR